MTDSTVVSAAPFVVALQPYLTAAATAIVGAMITVAAAAFTKWTGVRINADNLAVIKSAAETEAGKAVAAADASFASAKIDVGSPVVAAASDMIAARLPKVLDAAGLKTADIDHLVAGEIGKLQAIMASAPPAPAKSPAPVPIPITK